MDFSRLNEQALSAAYVAANTPRYLYRRFQADPSVQSLARVGLPELSNYLTSEAFKAAAVRSVEEWIQLYSAVVALSFVTDSGLPALIATLLTSPVGWVGALATLVEEKRRSTSIQVVSSLSAKLPAFASIPNAAANRSNVFLPQANIIAGQPITANTTRRIIDLGESK